MSRPKSNRPKKGNMPFSVTEAEKDYIAWRARIFGFPNASNFLLSLVEAQHRLGLVLAHDANGQRWFVLSESNKAPQNTTLRDAMLDLIAEHEAITSGGVKKVDRDTGLISAEVKQRHRSNG